MATDNLPHWQGSSAVYSKAYRRLEKMAQCGHVTQTEFRKGIVCHVSSDMQDLIEALNEGDEEQIKAILLWRQA